jgi:hypothetical protein
VNVLRVRSSVLALVAFAEITASCAASAPPRIVTRPAAPRVVERLVPWVASVVPESFGMPFRAGDEQDGSVNVFGGGMRISIRGDRVEWSHDATLTPIVGHARDGDHWLFASGDGALFRSVSFAGPLQRIGDTPPGWNRCGSGVLEECAGFDSTGLLAVRSASQQLFIGQSDGLSLARPPLDRPLVDVGFVDREFGVAITAPGELFRTVDGGAHVERIDLGGDAAFVVYPHSDSFVLATTRGLVRLERTGPITPFTGTADTFDHRIPEEAEHAIAETVVRDDPFAWPLMLSRGGVLLPDGRIATIEDETLHLRERDGDQSTFDLPNGSCTIEPFGPQLLAACENDAHQRTFHLFAVDRWADLQTLPEMGAFVAAPDGGSIVAIGPCSDDDTRPRDASLVCWYNGSTWQTRPLEPDAHLLAAHGDALLYVSSSPTRDGSLAFRLARDAAGDASETIALEGAHIESVSFAGDGELVVIAQRARELVYARGESPHGLVARPLPRGTARVGFADAMRGLAVGVHLTDTFVTQDGGANWSRLELPIDGDASSVLLEPTHDDRDDTALTQPICNAAYCAVEGRLVWGPPSLAAAANARLVAAARSAPPVPRERRIVDPADLGYHVRRIECDLRDAPRDDHSRDVPSTRIYGGDGWIDPHVTGATDSGAGRYAFVWSGNDDRGAFTARARPATLPPVDVNAASSTGIAVANSDSALLLARYVSRGLALLERCAGPYFAGQCDLVAIPAGGTPTILGTIRALVGADETVSHTRAVLPLLDGGVAVLISTAFPTVAAEDRLPSHLDLVLRLSPRGAIVARRAFAWARGRTYRMLARNAQGPGLVTITAPALRTLTFFDLDPAHPGIELATLPEGHLVPCATDTPNADATQLVSADSEFAPSLDIASGRAIILPPYNLRDTLEVSNGAVCFRGASLWSLNPADDLVLVSYLGGAPRIRASRGEWTGFVVGVPQSVPMRCEVP